MKKFYRRIPNWLKNKYALTILFFIVWLTFFDKNDFFTQYQYRKQLKSLEADRDYFKGAIEQTKKDLSELASSPASIEKFAREKYLMKKDDEDIFVFVQEPVKQETQK
jgi:cell division protein FtsB